MDSLIVTLDNNPENDPYYSQLHYYSFDATLWPCPEKLTINTVLHQSWATMATVWNVKPLYNLGEFKCYMYIQWQVVIFFTLIVLNLKHFILLIHPFSLVTGWRPAASNATQNQAHKGKVTHYSEWTFHLYFTHFLHLKN